MEVETALDGAICTDKVFAKGHSYYSIILVTPPDLSNYHPSLLTDSTV